MKLADTAVRPPEVLKWNALKRYVPTSLVKMELGAEDEVEDADGEVAEKDGWRRRWRFRRRIIRLLLRYMANLYCGEELSECDM
jgi:hypothetical protein